jgi:hypothetical protein
MAEGIGEQEEPDQAEQPQESLPGGASEAPMGALRHYFATQSELLCFAMQLVGDRARARIAALEPVADARRPAERLLHELCRWTTSAAPKPRCGWRSPAARWSIPSSGPSTSGSTQPAG